MRPAHSLALGPVLCPKAIVETWVCWIGAPWLLGHRMKPSWKTLLMLPVATNLFEGLGSEPWIPDPHSFIKLRVLKATDNDPVDLTRCILTKQSHKKISLVIGTCQHAALCPWLPVWDPRRGEFHAKSIFTAWTTGVECWASSGAWLSIWMPFLMKAWAVI